VGVWFPLKKKRKEKKREKKKEKEVATFPVIRLPRFASSGGESLS
jgi:hypothetical protein